MVTMYVKIGQRRGVKKYLRIEEYIQKESLNYAENVGILNIDSHSLRECRRQH